MALCTPFGAGSDLDSLVESTSASHGRLGRDAVFAFSQANVAGDGQAESMADHGDANASDRLFDFCDYSSVVVGLDRFVDRRKTRNGRHRAGSVG